MLLIYHKFNVSIDKEEDMTQHKNILMIITLHILYNILEFLIIYKSFLTST